MLAEATSTALGQHEDESSCDGMEAFVKSFIPSLFDSDSDTEDAYYPVSSSPALDSSLELSAPEQSCLGDGAFADRSAEASSPSSQGASSLSAFQPHTLDSTATPDEQSTFRTMHSVASCSTVFDDLFDDELPPKRAKITHGSPVQPARQVGIVPLLSDAGEAAFPGCRQVGHLPEAVKSSQDSPELLCSLPRPNSLQCLAPPSTPGMGACIPVPASPAMVADFPTASIWPSSASNKAAKGGPPFSAAPGPWPAPQSMIPTAPITMFYQQQQHGTGAGLPAVQQQPNVATALAQLADPAVVGHALWP